MVEDKELSLMALWSYWYVSSQLILQPILFKGNVGEKIVIQ